MLTIFEYRCLAGILLGKETRPTAAGRDQDKFDGKDREAIMLLKLSVTNEMLPEVQTETSSATIWKHLKEMHETSDKGRAFFLKNMLFSMVMEEHASLQEHLLKIKDIQEQLLAIGRTMEEEDMVVITLKILPHAYEHFIESPNITSTDIDLKFGELCNKLLQQDRWKNQFGSSSQPEGSERAFVANVKGKGKWAKQKGQGHGEDTPKSQKTFTYHYCGKVGHTKKHCRKQLADQKSNQGGPQQKAHVVEHTEEKESTFYTFMAMTQADKSRSFAWFIDFGASRHFTNRKD